MYALNQLIRSRWTSANSARGSRYSELGLHQPEHRPIKKGGFFIQDEAIDIARSASQGAHYHADVINLLEITESLPTKASTDQEKGCNQSLPPLNRAKNARTDIAGTRDPGVRMRYQFVF